MRSSAKTWLLVVVGVVLVALAAGLVIAVALPWFANLRARQAQHRAVVRRVAQPATPGARALASVGSVDAALKTGVDFGDYSALLATASADVAAYRPTDAKGAEVKKALAKAIVYYGAASEAWDADLASSWWSGEDVPLFWKNKYRELDFSAAGSHVTPDQVRQAAWIVAGKAYAQARNAAGASSP